METDDRGRPRCETGLICADSGKCWSSRRAVACAKLATAVPGPILDIWDLLDRQRDWRRRHRATSPPMAARLARRSRPRSSATLSCARWIAAWSGWSSCARFGAVAPNTWERPHNLAISTDEVSCPAWPSPEVSDYESMRAARSRSTGVSQARAGDDRGAPSPLRQPTTDAGRLRGGVACCMLAAMRWMGASFMWRALASRHRSRGPQHVLGDSRPASLWGCICIVNLDGGDTFSGHNSSRDPSAQRNILSHQ